MVPSAITLSVVIPVFNEAENVTALLEELEGVLDELDVDSEIVCVDDGSTDETPGLLEQAMTRSPRLRVLRLPATGRGTGNGQTAALQAGFERSGGVLIASMDGDLQNDPHDLPSLLDELQAGGADLVQGDRSAARRDPLVKRLSSFVAWIVRRLVLRDVTRDTGCTLRVMRREVADALPLDYRGMHRFMPVLARAHGFSVSALPVNHRPRLAGTSKYGVWNRLLGPLADCLAVRWMIRRRRHVTVTECMRDEVPVIEVTASEPPVATRS